MIKIPGTPRGPAGDRAGDLRGHQRQRHAAVHRRGLRDASPRRTSRASSAATPRARSLDVPLGRVVLRLARRHRGRQAPGGARPHRPAGQGRPSPTRAPPTAASRRSSTASASPRCAPPARPSSARCGPRPASRTRAYPETLYVDGARRPRHRQHDADADAAGLRRAPRGRPARPSREDPAAGARRARRGRASTWTTSPTSCCATASTRSSTPMEKLLAGIEAKREAIFTGRPETIDAVAARRARAARRRARRRADEERRRAPHLGQGRHALGRRRASPRSPTGSAG